MRISDWSSDVCSSDLPGPRAGRRLGVRDVGLIAAMNLPWVPVRRRPRVAILATGDEVVMPGEPLGPSQIVNSNGLALSAFVRACGGEPLLLPIAADTADSLVDLAAGGPEESRVGKECVRTVR